MNDLLALLDDLDVVAATIASWILRADSLYVGTLCVLIHDELLLLLVLRLICCYDLLHLLAREVLLEDLLISWCLLKIALDLLKVSLNLLKVTLDLLDVCLSLLDISLRLLDLDAPLNLLNVLLDLLNISLNLLNVSLQLLKISLHLL